jgi:hypothetical protein
MEGGLGLLLRLEAAQELAGRIPHLRGCVVMPVVVVMPVIMIVVVTVSGSHWLLLLPESGLNLENRDVGSLAPVNDEV